MSTNNFPSERVSNPLPITALGSWVPVLLHCIAEHAVCALISSPLVANVHFPVHDDGLYAYSPSSQHRYLLSPAIQEFTTMFGISYTMLNTEQGVASVHHLVMHASLRLE